MCWIACYNQSIVFWSDILYSRYTSYLYLMEYDYTYAPLQPKPVKPKHKFYTGLFMMTFGLVLFVSGFFLTRQKSAGSSTQVAVGLEQAVASEPAVAQEAPTALALLATEEELGSPATQAVAGTGQAEDGQATSGFGVVEEKTQLACQPEVFKIGLAEESPLDHPADEFNWVGALDVVPDYAEPFVVDLHQASDFPWRTSQDSNGNLNNNIQFEYKGSETTARLTIAWSPGTTGEASKLIYLDGEYVGSTDTYQGEFTQGTWQNMPLVKSQLELPLTAGSHTLGIKSMNNGSQAVWDYISLVNDCN